MEAITFGPRRTLLELARKRIAADPGRYVNRICGEHEAGGTSWLSCVQCHESLKGERTCNRYHQDRRDVDFEAIARKGTDFSFMASKGRDVSRLIDTTDCIDFKALGYAGDPILHGGRFKKLPLGAKPE